MGIRGKGKEKSSFILERKRIIDKFLSLMIGGAVLKKD